MGERVGGHNNSPRNFPSVYPFSRLREALSGLSRHVHPAAMQLCSLIKLLVGGLGWEPTKHTGTDLWRKVQTFEHSDEESKKIIETLETKRKKHKQHLFRYSAVETIDRDIQGTPGLGGDSPLPRGICRAHRAGRKDKATSHVALMGSQTESPAYTWQILAH